MALTCLCWCGLPLTHTDCLSYSLNQRYRSACSILSLLKRDLIVFACSLKGSKHRLLSICINNSNVLWKFIFICILSAFQELQMLASSRQPNFVIFTGGNLIRRCFLSLILLFYESSWNCSGSWIKAILILLDTPMKLPFLISESGLKVSAWITHKHLGNSISLISQVFSSVLQL